MLSFINYKFLFKFFCPKEKMSVNKGFTLLEVLLSIAIIAIISGAGVFSYHTFNTRNDLDIAAVTISQALRRAQALSQAVDGDINWGVFIQSGNITLFKGANYVSRDILFDEIFEMPIGITQSGISEIIFTKFTGLPQSVGALILTSINNETRTITINTKGIVEY